MKQKKIIFSLIIIFIAQQNLYSQFSNMLPSVAFEDTMQHHLILPFELVSNMMIIKMEINGSKPLNFILDSGCRQTILTQIPTFDSIGFNKARKTTIKGLGEGSDLTVWHTYQNTYMINNIICKNQHLFVLEEDKFNLSEQMGIEINGIIGGVIFENFIIKIDYINSRIILYNPKTFKYKRRHRKHWITLPLTIFDSKPYITVPLTIQGDSTIMANLLIDSGASDALWLFPGTNDTIVYKEGGTELFLGQGLNGSIYGKQSVIDEICFGKYILQDVTVSYPDTVSVNQSITMDISGRNGSIGAEILRRFDVILDYSNKKILLKKNSNFGDKFYFNLSGIEIETPFIGLPIYRISQIRTNSPADLAGLKCGDQIISINNMDLVTYTLNDIVILMRSKENRKIKMKVKRDNTEITVKFRLKKME